jgi:hypothetical protein
MTAAQRQAWDRARARIAVLQPAIALAVVKVFDLILDALPESKLTETIRDGALDDIIAVLLAQSALDRVTLPFRLALRDAIARSFRFSVPALPNGGKVNGTIAVVFDQLNPRVIAAMRTLETRAVADLTESARDTVRQSIARGLENRQRPAVIARELRTVIGLAPKDEAAVANFRAMLERGDRTALSRLLRDRRFDQTLERSLGADGKGLTAKQIDAMTAAYRRRAIAANAETVSRAATRSAYKLGDGRHGKQRSIAASCRAASSTAGGCTSMARTIRVRITKRCKGRPYRSTRPTRTETRLRVRTTHGIATALTSISSRNHQTSLTPPGAQHRANQDV